MDLRVWYTSLDNSERKSLQMLDTLVQMDFLIGVCILPILWGLESVLYGQDDVPLKGPWKGRVRASHHLCPTPKYVQLTSSSRKRSDGSGF